MSEAPAKPAAAAAATPEVKEPETTEANKVPKTTEASKEPETAEAKEGTEKTAARETTEAAPAASDAPIEVDEPFNDNDSAIEDQLSAFTASLTSSVTDYPVEHGRRYHAYRRGVYPFPNDEREQSRLDLTHELMTKGIGEKLYLAPVPKEKMNRILDIGTGTGIWSIEMGDLFPHAEILGNDLSPTQPSWVPPNVKFEVDDVESPWMYNTPFDYIFCRYMTACILDWPALVRNIYENVAPGGYVEFQDFDFNYYSEDGSLNPSTHTHKWIYTLLGATEKTGREASPGPKLEGWVKDAGFVNVVHQRFKLPIGPWAKDERLKEVGLFNLAQLLEGLEGFSLQLYTGILGWSKEEVLVMLTNVRKELKSHSLHAQFDFHVVYAQKPS